MATEKFIPESNAAPVAFNSKRHAAHQRAYRLRRKDGRVAALLPWRWLTLQDVQRLAVEAYRSASYGLSRDLPDPNCSPESFAYELQQAFEVLVADAALAAGVLAGPAGAPAFARRMRQDVPADWKPQYPVFVSSPSEGYGGTTPCERSGAAPALSRSHSKANPAGLAPDAGDAVKTPQAGPSRPEKPGVLLRSK